MHSNVTESRSGKSKAFLGRRCQVLEGQRKDRSGFASRRSARRAKYTWMGGALLVCSPGAAPVGARPFKLHQPKRGQCGEAGKCGRTPCRSLTPANRSRLPRRSSAADPPPHPPDRPRSLFAPTARVGRLCGVCAEGPLPPCDGTFLNAANASEKLPRSRWWWGRWGFGTRRTYQRRPQLVRGVEGAGADGAVDDRQQMRS